jgi:hypothetical protein
MRSRMKQKRKDSFENEKIALRLLLFWGLRHRMFVAFRCASRLPVDRTNFQGRA